MAAPSSGIQSAPQSEITAPTIQTRMVGNEAVKAAAIALGTMKIDEAMIVPTLIMVASRRPSSWRRPSSPRVPEAAGWFARAEVEDIGCPKLPPDPGCRNWPGRVAPVLPGRYPTSAGPALRDL